MTAKNKEITIKVAGECFKVNRSDDFKKTIKQLLIQKGVSVYSIIVDGKEVNVDQIPETFEQCQTVEVARQVTAGE